MLEEAEHSENHDTDCVAHPSTSNADDSGVAISHSPVSCQKSSFDSNRDSVTGGSIPASTSTDVQSVSTRASSTDLLDDDPWLPVSTKSHSPVHSSARNNLFGGKSLSSSHLQCCNSAATIVPHSAVGRNSENLCSELCVASSNLHCRCGEKVQEMCVVDDDEVVNSDAGLRHNLAEIKEGMTVNCFDTEHDQVTGTNHPSSTDCEHNSFRQSNLDRFPRIRAEDSSGPRPVRKASLNGLRKAVRSVLVHRNSLISDRPANLTDCDPCRSPSESFASGFSDQSRTRPGSTEKSNNLTGSKRLSKTDGRNYFGSSFRSQRSGLAVDSVRQSLSHLLRTGDHGSSVVGERMAVGCLEQPVSNTLTLSATRRTSRRVLSGNFDDVAIENHVLQPELSRTLSETDDQSDNESDGVTTTTYLSELDTSDSFYESRLFDALETQENDDGADGGFDSYSSDDGTYSAESFSDLAPSDDHPTSSASSHRSSDADGPSNSSVPRHSDPAATDNSGQDERDAPDAITSHLLHQTVRQQSGWDVKSRELAGGSRCSLMALQQPSRLNDITDSASPQQIWKRLSL